MAVPPRIPRPPCSTAILTVLACGLLVASAQAAEDPAAAPLRVAALPPVEFNLEEEFFAGEPDGRSRRRTRR